MVIDHHACTEYYCKGRETVVRDVFIDVVFYLSDDLSQRAAIKKLVIEAAGERYGDSRGNASDIIFELYRSSFNTLPVSLENRGKKNAFYNLQELNLKNHYGKEYQSFNLTDFFACYEIEKTGLALIKSKLF